MAGPPASPTPSSSLVSRVLSPQVLLPFIVIFGYVAFLITGIDAGRNSGRDPVQPIALYVYFSALLILLQLAISETRTLGRALYVFAAGAFAIIYAGEVMFNAEGHKPGNFTLSAWTYIIINALLLIVFIVDAISRRLPSRGSGSSWLRQLSPISYRALAADFGGLAILFFVAAFLLDLLGRRQVFQALGLNPGTPYVVVDLNTTLGLRLPEPINRLEAVDVGIGFAALAVSLLLLVIVGALTISTAPNKAAAENEAEDRFGGALQGILGEAVDQTLLSLRLVLSPLIWLIPAFSIGNFARNVADYLRTSARNPNSQILDLFNPVNANSLENLPTLGVVLLLAALAVGTVILSVAIVEHDLGVVRHTVRIFAVAGRIAGLTLGFFLYSLAALNAGAILFLFTKAEVFQVGTGGLLALLIGGLLVVYNLLRDRVRKPPTPAKTPARV